MQSEAMRASGDSRSILRDALQRSLIGQPAPQICEVLPSPAGLSQLEKGAWLQLHNWLSDAPLRGSFASHAEYSRNRMNYFLEALQ